MAAKKDPGRLVAKAINDPGKIYTGPESVLLDGRLTPSEKDKILHSWEEDQLALMRAEEESMTSKDGSLPATDLLQRVKLAEKDLENIVSPVKKKPPA